jgi:RNA polymerase sigma factor (sigma-70 family)
VVHPQAARRVRPGLNRNRTGVVYTAVALSDESLLVGMAAGDPDAAAVFVRRYQSRVYGFAVTVVGSAAIAEEVAQETFVRVWRHAATYDVRRGKVATWVLTITRNLAIDALRLSGERPVDPHLLVGSLVSREPGEVPGSRYEDGERLRSALRTLPPEQSKPIVLSVFYGLTAQEVADREGIPLGTAKTRIRRGLAKLREVLKVTDE